MPSVLRSCDLSVTGFASFRGLISYRSIFLNALQNEKIERKTNTNSQMQYFTVLLLALDQRGMLHL